MATKGQHPNFTLRPGGPSAPPVTAFPPVRNIDPGFVVGGPKVNADLASKLTGSQRDAYLAVETLFESYGLGSLAPKIYDFIVKGYSADTISILLQDTDEYKQRFAGNEARRKAGLPVLSPAEYLATESAYRQVMQAAGLPKGFYDSPSDFAGFIGQDTSVNEISQRVSDAARIAQNTDPAYRKMLADQYGIHLDDGAIAAYMLDKNRALPLIERDTNSILISEGERRQGLAVDKMRADQLAMLGVTGDQLNQAGGQLADLVHNDTGMARAIGSSYTQADAEDETLLGLASARRKRMDVEQNFGAYSTHSASRSAPGALSGDTSNSY